MEQNLPNRDFRKKKQLWNFGSDFDLLVFLNIARKSLLHCLGIAAVCAVVGFLYIRYTPQLFESILTLQVGNSNTAKKVLEVDNIYETDDISAEIELLRSPYLIERAIKRLPLEVSIYNEGQFLTEDMYGKEPFKVELIEGRESIYENPVYVDVIDNKHIEISVPSLGIEDKTEKIGEEIVINGCRLTLNHVDLKHFEMIKGQVKENKTFFKVNKPDILTKKIARKIDVQLLNSKASTISISMTDRNPQKVADVVTALAEEFRVYDVERRSQSARNVLEFINAQLDVVYNKLKLSENNIQEFRKSHGISNVEEYSNIYLNRLSSFEDNITDLELQLNVLKEIEKSLQLPHKNDDVSNLLAILSGTEYEGTIRTFINSLQELLVEKQNMLYEATPDNSAIKAIDNKIEIQKNLLLESLEALVTKLENRKKDLISKSNEIEGKFLGIPEKELEHARLQRMLSIDQKFFDLLVEKRTEYSISEAGFVPQNTILEEATVPSTPVSPNKKIVLIAFTAAALLFSLILILIRYLFYNHISSLDELERIIPITMPVLGVIPKYKKNIPTSQLVIPNNPKSILAEAFRSIRSSMAFMNKNIDVPIISITSTISGEGKTFVAINLGGILALSGKRVIILDLDMRKPKIHKGFESENEVGMSTILSEQTEFKSAIQHSKLENLDFITAGPVPPNPSELIINGKLETLLATLKKEYNFIILDNPPVGLVTDGIPSLSLADVPIYVLRAEYSKRHFVRNIERVKEEYNLPKLSVVLNSVNFESQSYKYGYGYGYGDGYYED